MTDLDALPPDPIAALNRWREDAAEAGHDPDVVCLATVAPGGTPDARMVLVKHVAADGLRWFTDHRSPKARAIDASGRAALVWHWHGLERQVRVRGTVARLDDDAADAYFAARPRGSQLSAWASHQSQPVADRETLERQLAEVEARFADGPVPRPPHWGGYVLTPTEVELWQGRPARLHDRLLHVRTADGWERSRLQP